MYAVPPESSQTLDQLFPRQIEVLINIFQSIRRHRLNPNQCALDARGLHRIQKFQVLSGFHRDLCEENHVIGELRQTRHQHEPLIPNGLQFVVARGVVLSLRQFQIGNRHRIKVVIGERDEAKAHPAQLYDFFYYYVGSSLPRALSVRPPHRAERAVLGAASHRLYRRPHVTVAWNQVPSRGNKIAGLNLASRIHRLGYAGSAVFQRSRPGNVSVSFYHRMSATEFAGFFGIKRGVNPAEYYISSPLPRDLSNFIPPQRVCRVNPDSYKIALLNVFRVHLVERLIHKNWLSKFFRGGGG